MKKPGLHCIVHRRHWIKPLLLVLGAGCMLASGILFHLPTHLHTALAWIAGLGWTGIAAFILLYVLACVLFVPGSILTLGAGVIFGAVEGSAIVSAAATLGAGAAFLTGRYLARTWVSSRIQGNRVFRALDTAIAEEGWKIVFLARLSPVFPFNLLNYAFGLTQVRFRDYISASWLGMLPGTILYVYSGSLAGNLIAVGQGRPTGLAAWGFYTAGLLATLVVTLYITRLAKRSLSEKIPERAAHG